MKNLIFLLVVSLLLFVSCKSTEVAMPNYNGAEQILGNGKAFTWIKLSSDNKPTSIGVTLEGSFGKSIA